MRWNHHPHHDSTVSNIKPSLRAAHGSHFQANQTLANFQYLSGLSKSLSAAQWVQCSRTASRCHKRRPNRLSPSVMRQRTRSKDLLLWPSFAGKAMKRTYRQLSNTFPLSRHFPRNNPRQLGPSTLSPALPKDSPGRHCRWRVSEAATSVALLHPHPR
jgi:hypothetical protein